MPLSSAVATSQVRLIVDVTMTGHSWPESTSSAAQRWADAIGAYFADIAAPVLSPGTVDAAKIAMVAAFAPAGTLAGLEAGLAAFAAVIVAGMVAGQVGTPPPTAPVWGSTSNTSDATARAAQLGAAIDAWARTGLTGPAPGPPALPWS